MEIKTETVSYEEKLGVSFDRNTPTADAEKSPENSREIDELQEEEETNNIIRTYVSKSTSTGSLFFCYHCENKYTTLKLLKCHIESCHLAQGNVGRAIYSIQSFEALFGFSEGRCQKCNHIPTNVSDLMNHKCETEKKVYYECPLFDLTPVEVVFGTSEGTSDKELLKCEHCNFSTIHKSGLSHHLSFQHASLVEKKPFPCPHCPLTYQHQAALKSHISSRHEKKKNYICQYCGLGLTRSHTLKDHIQVVHLKNRRYSCPHCDYTAPIASYVKAHIRRHGTERQYRCRFCSYSSIRSNTLDAHVRSKHTKDRPHKCPECDFSCLRPSFLKQHILAKHTDERPFPCTVCDYKTVRAAHLKSHMMTHVKAAEKLAKKAELLKKTYEANEMLS